jgi:hypothetical protein
MCLVAAQKSGFGAFSDTASVMRDVRLQGQSRRNLEAPALPLMTRCGNTAKPNCPFRQKRNSVPANTIGSASMAAGMDSM